MTETGRSAPVFGPLSPLLGIASVLCLVWWRVTLTRPSDCGGSIPNPAWPCTSTTLRVLLVATIVLCLAGVVTAAVGFDVCRRNPSDTIVAPVLGVILSGLVAFSLLAAWIAEGLIWLDLIL